MNDPADEYDRDGNARKGVPFDSANTAALESIASSLLDINHSLKVMASVAVSARDILRGRNEGGDVIQSPLRAMAEAVVKLVARPAQTAASPASALTHGVPPTQRPAQQAAPQQAQPTNGKRYATDHEMSGPKADPKIRFDPKRDWIDNGKPSFKGRNASGCHPDFLDLYADQLDYFVSQAQKKIDVGDQDTKLKDSVKYDALDAARARTWAVRIRRTGYVEPPPANIPTDGYSIPSI